MIYVDVDINQCVCVYVFEGFELAREIKLELALIGAENKEYIRIIANNHEIDNDHI